MESRTRLKAEGRKWRPAWGMDSKTGISGKLKSLQHYRGNVKAARHVPLLWSRMSGSQTFGAWDLFWCTSLCPVSSIYSVYSVIFSSPIELCWDFWVTLNSMLIQHPKWICHFDRVLGTQRPKIGSGMETLVFLVASAEGHGWVQSTIACVSTSSY